MPAYGVRKPSEPSLTSFTNFSQNNLENLSVEKKSDSTGNKRDFSKIISLESDFYHWLEFLGLKLENISIDRCDLFKDNLRNGFFLCQIVARLWPEQKSFLKSVAKEPTSMKECSNNVDLGLTMLKQNWKEFPYSNQLLKKISILKGDKSVIYPLFLL